MEQFIAKYGWIMLGLISALGAAGVAIFGSIGLRKVNSILATALRSIIMAALLIAITLSTGQLQTVWRGGSNLDNRAWLYIVLAGLAGAISWLAYFRYDNFDEANKTHCHVERSSTLSLKPTKRTVMLNEVKHLAA